MIHWPFVSRKKYQQALDAIEALRKTCDLQQATIKSLHRICDEKQKVLMHYKNHYYELAGLVYHPRAQNGRFIKKDPRKSYTSKKTQEASPCLILN